MTCLIITLTSLILSGIFSGTEIAYISGDRVRIELDVKQGGIIGRILNRFYSHRELFISTILVGNNIVLVVYSMAAAILLEPYIKQIYDNEAFVLVMQTIISTGIILIAGEFIPKTVFRINPNTSMRLVSPLIFLFYLVLYPIAAFTSWLSKMLMRLCGISTSSDPLTGLLSIEQLNNYIERTIEQHGDNKTGAPAEVEHEVKMFHNALDFSSRQLRDCMIPRNELIATDINTVTRAHLSELFTRSGRSKIILFDNDIDNIVGYIHVSELFDPSIDWKTRVKPVIFAPETLLANKMMRRLMTEKRSLAVVIDEFGGTAGIVTLEDLVEEIFGDIRDEHDKPELAAVEVEPGVFEISGRTEVRTLRDEYQIDIPEDDEYQTLAGYILYRTGSLPQRDATFTIDNLTFTILSRTASRLELIRLDTNRHSPAE
ncbi:MAG: HlyC/CorC family transporter [Muribaculaceae bacterium]|nr:HlyC/CorC family transporter [Muribaculaceae bacterium]